MAQATTPSLQVNNFTNRIQLYKIAADSDFLTELTKAQLELIDNEASVYKQGNFLEERLQQASFRPPLHFHLGWPLT